MRSIEQSFDLISRQLKNSANHLDQYSSRKDLAAGNYHAIKELSLLEDQVTTLRATLESEERKILKMREIWIDMLLRLYLYMCINGRSSSDFIRILQQPIDFLIGPFEASLKSEIDVKHFTSQEYSVEDGIAYVEAIERQHKMVEQKIQNYLMATRRQIESIITKSISS